MPVIVNARERHPFLPSLGDPAAIEASRARQQKVRPLEIAIVNLMADKATTEKQLAHWLGGTPLQVKLTFAATDDYVQGVQAGRQTRNVSSAHIKKFYNPFSAIKDRKFDGLVLTGVNALKPSVTEEAYWPAVKEILDWSVTNALSSCFLCWGAKAALKHFHDIDSHKAEQKHFGLHEHRLLSDKTGVLEGFPDVFSIPVSRWKTPRPEDVRAVKELEIAAETKETGPSIMVESRFYQDGSASFPYPWRLYVLPHPEYETVTLRNEYLRDWAQNDKTPLPVNYFPGNDPAREPVNTWRQTANVYTNWVKLIYEATPYDLAEIPQSYRRIADQKLESA